MTRRSIFSVLAAAFVGSILAKTSLAGYKENFPIKQNVTIVGNKNSAAIGMGADLIKTLSKSKLIGCSIAPNDKQDGPMFTQINFNGHLGVVCNLEGYAVIPIENCANSDIEYFRKLVFRK